VEQTLASGAYTADIAPRGGSYVSTGEFAQQVIGYI
jgi:hypothetical protein